MKKNHPSENEMRQLNNEELELQKARGFQKETPEATRTRRLAEIKAQQLQEIEKCANHIALFKEKMQGKIDSCKEEIEQQINRIDIINKNILGVDPTSSWPKPLKRTDSDYIYDLDDEIADAPKYDTAKEPDQNTTDNSAKNDDVSATPNATTNDEENDSFSISPRKTSSRT